MEDKKVKELAENLRKNGLAASMEEALETARKILGEKRLTEEKEADKEVEEKAPEEKKAEKQKTLTNKNDPSYDITKETKTLKELMNEEEDD